MAAQTRIGKFSKSRHEGTVRDDYGHAFRVAVN